MYACWISSNFSFGYSLSKLGSLNISVTDIFLYSNKMGNNITIVNEDNFSFEEWYLGNKLFDEFASFEQRDHSNSVVELNTSSTLDTLARVALITAPKGSKLRTASGLTVQKSTLKTPGGYKDFYILGAGTFYMEKE